MSKKINELFFMKSWAMKEDVLTSFTEIVIRHISGQKLSMAEIEARTGASTKDEPPDYAIDAKGTARIPIYGVIAKRASMVNGISQPPGTSVEEIRRDFNAALNDPAVKSIVLDVDSPGGSVDGITELSDLIYAARGKKPINAYTDGQMASAAYWIGSAADKIYATKSAEVGSIGVYAVVHDFSRSAKNEGIDTTVIKAGKYKAAGYAYKHLSEDDQSAIQDNVNSYYDLFVDGVARNRGISAEDALKLANGKTYIGKKAVNIGLIDGIRNIEEVFEIKACSNTYEDKKRRTQVLIPCKGCNEEIDFEGQPKTAAGAVECPKCGRMIDQEGKVLVDKTVETKQKKEEGSMEIKDLTLETLKAQRSDLVEAILKDGKEASAQAVKDGVSAERARVLGIIGKAKVYKDAGVEDLVKGSIEKGETVEIAESGFKTKKIDSLTGEAPKTPGPGEDVGAAAKTHLDIAKEYAAANKCSITKALQATAPKRVKA
ncbi:MAG: signal peptide peptidase SppA [Candidatus Omnitrophica bacterium]|nr:signal peptide peptidase SppA [Candidatus Omnitrophota bacterium]